MVVTLTEHWTESVWDRVGQLLEAGVPEVPYEPAEPRKVRQRHRVTWLKPEQVAEMTADYESGMTVVAVAKKYGVAPETASRRLKANGVAIGPATAAIPASELRLLDGYALRAGRTRRLRPVTAVAVLGLSRLWSVGKAAWLPLDGPEGRTIAYLPGTCLRPHRRQTRGGPRRHCGHVGSRGVRRSRV